MNDTAELWHPWCRANECCLHRGIPKPNWCASSYGTLSSSLSSTSFFKTLVAIAISGLAHRADQLSQLLRSCMRYKQGDSEPELDTDACPRFTVSSLVGPILRARGVTALLKDYFEHVMLQQRLLLWRSETSRSMETSLFNTSRGTGSSSWVWLRSMYQQKTKTGTRKSNTFLSSLFFFFSFA